MSSTDDSDPYGILEGTPKLKSFSLQQPVKQKSHDVNAMNQDELLALRDEIEQKLEGITLSDVNLVKETMIQFKKAKKLQIDASAEDSEVPMNQRAQVQNSIANILDRLSKMQTELYDSEKLKRLQAAVIKIVKTLPKEQQDSFFEQMEIEIAQVEVEVDA